EARSEQERDVFVGIARRPHPAVGLLADRVERQGPVPHGRYALLARLLGHDPQPFLLEVGADVAADRHAKQGNGDDEGDELRELLHVLSPWRATIPASTLIPVLSRCQRNCPAARASA